MVERVLRMYEVPGSIPGTSTQVLSTPFLISSVKRRAVDYFYSFPIFTASGLPPPRAGHQQNEDKKKERERGREEGMKE